MTQEEIDTPKKDRLVSLWGPLFFYALIFSYSTFALVAAKSDWLSSFFTAIYNTGSWIRTAVPVIDKYHSEMVAEFSLSRAFAITSINIVIVYVFLLYALFVLMTYRRHYNPVLHRVRTAPPPPNRVWAALVVFPIWDAIVVLGAAGVFPSKINNKRYYWDSVTHFNSDIDTVFTSLFFFAVLWMFVVSFFFFWAVLAEKKRLGT